jgi:pantetheine-phosphate adenylyltransferase
MKKIAVCPGSFDPVTLGHIDIVERAADIFDEVIVLVMSNSTKSSSLFTIEERIDFINRCVTNSNVKVDTYNGLLVEYAKQKGAVAIVKGLRALSDFEYEFQQALTNKSLNPDVETVFLTTRGKNMFLSSSMVKEVCRLGGDISSFVPECITEDIYKRCKGDNQND